MAQEKAPIPVEFTRLKPRLRIRPLIGPRENLHEGKRDSNLERLISHRLGLEPTGNQPVDQDFFDKRTTGTGYVYRGGVGKNRRLKLVDGSKGYSSKGQYLVETTWAVRHPVAAVSSFVMHRGRWELVTFPEPTQNPPNYIQRKGKFQSTQGR